MLLIGFKSRFWENLSDDETKEEAQLASDKAGATA